MTYTLLTALCLAAPHILYAFIWYQPQIWRAQFRKDSVHVFAQVATSLKVLQFSAILAWVALNSQQWSYLSLSQVPLTLWLPCLAAIAAGQVLNVAIYKAIGKAGVYYGFKLGSPVPWHTGFPFNVVSHPQYVGSVLTIWGAGLLMMQQAPKGWTLMLAYWSALYVLTGLQEQFT